MFQFPKLVQISVRRSSRLKISNFQGVYLRPFLSSQKLQAEKEVRTQRESSSIGSSLQNKKKTIALPTATSADIPADNNVVNVVKPSSSDDSPSKNSSSMMCATSTGSVTADDISPTKAFNLFFDEFDLQNGPKKSFRQTPLARRSLARRSGVISSSLVANDRSFR
ncbi:hypothetical protein L596_015506 [Steinernema carpocapsae]|uniref:Uncharacterized protein n=1 Tax=Steinernema carpocapsae TaxID=34508 RepID=A0A4U5NG29_STECR|nr:hypothetical protein L596_015506 [Steinernema carpocapsae]